MGPPPDPVLCPPGVQVHPALRRLPSGYADTQGRPRGTDYGTGGNWDGRDPRPSPREQHTPLAARLTALRTRRRRPGGQPRRGPTSLRGPAPAASASSLGGSKPRGMRWSTFHRGVTSSCYETQNRSQIRSRVPPPRSATAGTESFGRQAPFSLSQTKMKPRSPKNHSVPQFHWEQDPGRPLLGASRGRALEMRAAEVRKPCGAASQLCPAGSPLDPRGSFSAACSAARGRRPQDSPGKFHLTREVFDPDGVTFPLQPGALKVIQSHCTQQP